MLNLKMFAYSKFRELFKILFVKILKIELGKNLGWPRKRQIWQHARLLEKFEFRLYSKNIHLLDLTDTI